VHEPETSVEYFKKCWKFARHHKIAVAVAFAFAIYGILVDYGPILALPEWSKPDKWPKLPVSWALVVVLVAIAYILMEGGASLHRETLRSGEAERKSYEQRIERLEESGPEVMLEYWPNKYPSFLVLNNLCGGTAHHVKVHGFRNGDLSCEPKEFSFIAEGNHRAFKPDIRLEGFAGENFSFTDLLKAAHRVKNKRSNDELTRLHVLVSLRDTNGTREWTCDFQMVYDYRKDSLAISLEGRSGNEIA
jgi:hypothetical protein